MKKILFLITGLLSFSLVTVHAQTNHYLGFQTGMGIHNNVITKVGVHGGFIGGVNGGISYRLNHKNWVLDAGLSYEQRGHKYNTVIVYNENGVIRDEGIGVYRFGYASLPIKVGYTIGHKFSFIPKLGLQLSGNINQTATINGSRIIPISFIRPLDITGLLDFEFAFLLKEKSQLFMGVSGYHSFTPFMKDESGMVGYYHYGLGINAGMRFRL